MNRKSKMNTIFPRNSTAVTPNSDLQSMDSSFGVQTPSITNWIFQRCSPPNQSQVERVSTVPPLFLLLCLQFFAIFESYCCVVFALLQTMKLKAVCRAPISFSSVGIEIKNVWKRAIAVSDLLMTYCFQILPPIIFKLFVSWHFWLFLRARTQTHTLDGGLHHKVFHVLHNIALNLFKKFSAHFHLLHAFISFVLFTFFLLFLHNSKVRPSNLCLEAITVRRVCVFA